MARVVHYDVKTKPPKVPAGTRPPPGYVAVQPWGALPLKPPGVPLKQHDGSDVFATPADGDKYTQCDLPQRKAKVE